RIRRAVCRWRRPMPGRRPNAAASVSGSAATAAATRFSLYRRKLHHQKRRRVTEGVLMTITDHDHPIDPARVAHAQGRLPSPEDASRLTSLLSLMADPVRIRLIYALDV